MRCSLEILIACCAGGGGGQLKEHSPFNPLHAHLATFCNASLNVLSCVCATWHGSHYPDWIYMLSVRRPPTNLATLIKNNCVR